MEKNTVLLQETEAFMRGELDNVTVSMNSVVLDLVQGSYVPYGCYTSAPIPLPLFDALWPSWNAATPPDTAVEMQVRVLVDGNWTAWMAFGKWSLYLQRAGAAPRERGPLQLTPTACCWTASVPPRRSCASTCTAKTTRPPPPCICWVQRCGWWMWSRPAGGR